MNWSDLRKSKVEDVCKYVAEMYLKEEKLSIVAEKLGAHACTIVNFMNTHREGFEKSYPALHKDYIDKKEQVRIDKYNKNGTAWKNCRVLDASKDFKDLPKVIKYKDFLNYLLQYNTNGKSTDKIMELAAKQGIKVVI